MKALFTHQEFEQAERIKIFKRSVVGQDPVGTGTFLPSGSGKIVPDLDLTF
jgi:hypothetical protein